MSRRGKHAKPRPVGAWMPEEIGAELLRIFRGEEAEPAGPGAEPTPGEREEGRSDD